jgi:hypothetical protein
MSVSEQGKKVSTAGAVISRAKMAPFGLSEKAAVPNQIISKNLSLSCNKDMWQQLSKLRHRALSRVKRRLGQLQLSTKLYNSRLANKIHSQICFRIDLANYGSTTVHSNVT